MPLFRLRTWWIASLPLLGCGCSDEALWGEGEGADASVTTPSGIQSGAVSISYILTSSSNDTNDVAFFYSTDGEVFRPATEGVGGSGTEDLASSPLGESHVFVWDSGSDLDGDRESSVVFRVRPDGGTSDLTGTFTVNNGRFLAVVEERETARVHLTRVDVVDGELRFLSTVTPGGTDPYEVIFVEGFFIVANRTSGDVSVLDLDEGAGRLEPVADSPFSVDGVRPTYLASDTDRVFVSNTASDTITIFRFDQTSGGLSTTSGSGVPAPGCEDIVVRGTRLYVANEAGGQILVFDIDGDELLVNGSSPITGGGLTSPRALVVAGTRVYAANTASASLCGFNVQGGGGLSPVLGSPFAISSTSVEDLAWRGSRLVAVDGAGATLLALTLDAFGAVSEDATSPFTLSGPAVGVAAGGDVIVTGTTVGELLEAYRDDGLGSLVPATPPSLDVSVPVLRVALSD